jgi:hypothetical protein
MPDDTFTKAMQTVIERARTDPEFFHRLVFDPDSVMQDLPNDRMMKSAVFGIDPNMLIGSLLAGGGGSPVAEGCTTTCGGSSCTSTCGSRSCDDTCASSCTDTCSHSCTNTTKLTLDPEELASLRTRVDILRGRNVAGRQP